MPSKEELRKKFSADPDRYYRVQLFDRLGFIRKKCANCDNFFWTLDDDRSLCPECEGYTFIGNAPVSTPLSYVTTWEMIENFFVKNGHTSVKRYPVVARWRPDLYFTVASIIDFQRIEGGKVVFDFPANPLIVPQMCLRFNDIENVGVTGRHYTSFCMVGQQALADEQGYWKDKTIDLDFELLTQVFNLPKREITFVEDVWLGYGAFGYSLEYYVRGLELGNAVFTEFEGSPDRYRQMEKPVVDMGAGLERFTWLTNGSPTSYESTFGPVFKRLSDVASIELNKDVLARYFRLAGKLDIPETQDSSLVKHQLAKKLGLSDVVVEKQIAPLEAIFAVLDHTRTLLFAIADGALPSNVAGGYNLRVIYRRAKSFLDKYGWRIGITELIHLHAEYLKRMYPELYEALHSVDEVLSVEEQRYYSSLSRAETIIQQLKKKGTPTLEEMIKLYDSEGITPELLKARGLDVTIPADFYRRVTERHMIQKAQNNRESFDVTGLPATELLYYEDQDLYDFQAKVLKVFEGKWVVLDRTAFFARSGGQEPDHGLMGSAKVVEAIKYGDVVLHRIEGHPPAEGEEVNCKVDRERREIIMRHHTATHILNGAARQLLGPWVWQHSAFKDVDGARLDITHHSPLTPEQVKEIERLANKVVRENLPVELHLLPRSEAERRYGFRLYQGGIVPTKVLRVRKIGDFDVEACGGTHCNRTGDIGLIKITRVERIQDGIDRLEFLAGQPALDFVEARSDLVEFLSSVFTTQPENLKKVLLSQKEEFEQLKKNYKSLAKRLAAEMQAGLAKMSYSIGGIKLVFISDEYLDEQAHIAIGDVIITSNPDVVYVGFVVKNGGSRIVVFAGSKAVEKGVNASELVREVSRTISGSGGGTSRLGQGGGKIPDSTDLIREKVIEKIRVRLGVDGNETK
ncbi:MAG: alanine--tRNA ligase [Conexivisphaerales archaeon]